MCARARPTHDHSLVKTEQKNPNDCFQCVRRVRTKSQMFFFSGFFWLQQCGRWLVSFCYNNCSDYSVSNVCRTFCPSVAMLRLPLLFCDERKNKMNGICVNWRRMTIEQSMDEPAQTTQPTTHHVFISRTVNPKKKHWGERLAWRCGHSIETVYNICVHQSHRQYELGVLFYFDGIDIHVNQLLRPRLQYA